MSGYLTNRKEQPASGLLSQLSAELSDSYRGVKDWFAQFNGKSAPATTTPALPAPNTADAFEQLFDELPGGVVMLDEYDVVQSCNRAARVMLGEPLLGMHWEGVAARLTFIDEGNDVVLVRHGTRLINLVASQTQNGKIVMLSDTIKTPSEIGPESSADLAENAMRLAHQIRTPLALASFYTGHLRRNGGQERERHVFVDKISAALNHVEKIVQEILAFSNEAGDAHEEIGVAALLQDFRRQSLPVLKNNGCELTVNDQAPRAALRGGRCALLEALNHLATNAINACGQGGRLRLTVQISGTDAVDIMLSDNGPGIPEDVQRRILEPFFSTKSQATGLGLPRVQAIVQAHQGALWFKSEPGHGTTFVLHLPAKVPAGAQIIDLAERRGTKQKAQA